MIVSKPSPVLLFVFDRPEHTINTLDALSKNKYSKETDLIVYCDGPKEVSSPNIDAINQVRKVVKGVTWSNSLKVIERSSNYGLARSIVTGITEQLEKHDSVIVMEDDIYTSPGFLEYINSALIKYKDSDEIMMVSGFTYPFNYKGTHDTYTYPANSCWGWATWKSAWSHYQDNALDLYLALIEAEIDWKEFNALQGDAFRQQLLWNIEKRIVTWAVKWHATMHLHGGTVLHPTSSLVRNIGFDGSGVHCGVNQELLDQPLTEKIATDTKPISYKDAEIYNPLNTYFRMKERPDLKKLFLKTLKETLKQWLRRTP